MSDLLPMPPASGEVIDIFPRQDGGEGLGSGMGGGVGAGAGEGAPAAPDIPMGPPEMARPAAPPRRDDDVGSLFELRWASRQGLVPPPAPMPAGVGAGEGQTSGGGSAQAAGMPPEPGPDFSLPQPRRGTLRMAGDGVAQQPADRPAAPAQAMGPPQDVPTGARLTRDLANTWMSVSQGLSQVGLEAAQLVDDPDIRARLDPSWNDDGPATDRLRAAREVAQQRGLDVVFRVNAAGQPEAVLRTPEMAPPGGAVGRIADGLGRMLGLGFVDPIAGAAVTGMRGGVVGTSTVTSAGGAGPRATRQAAAPAYQHDASRISTRLPTGMRATEDPVTGNLQIGLEAMRADPRVFDANVDLLRAYPNMPARGARSAERVAEQFIEHVRSNLLWLYDQVPAATRDRSRLWYDGARVITDRWAADYDLSDRSVAAVLAALSPQKDWFQNVSLARRVLDIYTTNGTGRVFDDALEETARRLFTKPEYQPLIDSLRGLRFDEVTGTAERALWLRAYDQTANAPSYHIITPEGEFADLARNANGSLSRIGWGSLGEIGKAIEALDARGDVSVLTRLLGERHKVRSFYNNIVAPASREGDVTIDTHAVAAGLLRPLSGNSLEVAHNFANYPGAGLPTAKGSALSGVQGTYGLYAEAYRRAAADRGVLPREMQSITWEAVRGLFPDTFKTAANMTEIDAIWREYRAGRATIEDVRRQVSERAGGIRAPEWDRPSAGGAATARDPGDAGDVSRPGVRGSSAGTERRAGGGSPARSAGLEPVSTPAGQPAGVASPRASDRGAR